MKEDAVAPVVAAMLILAVIATFFAAWNAYYVPSLKAQSENAHLNAVENGFLDFSSAVENAAMLKRDGTLSEPIPLGGGDIAFSPIRSGGELRVWNMSPDGYVHMDWTSEAAPAGPGYTAGMARFSYMPVNNFWQEQGYGWKYGVVYVINTQRNLSTPLLYDRNEDISYDGFSRPLLELQPVLSPASPGNCSAITVRVVNITPDRRHLQASGNGNSRLELVSRVNSSPPVLNATTLNIRMTAPPGLFNTTLWDAVTQKATALDETCANVKLQPPPASGERKIELAFGTYPYPNMSVMLETTEIAIGAY